MPLPQLHTVFARHETDFRLPSIASQDVLPFALFLLAAVSLVRSKRKSQNRNFRGTVETASQLVAWGLLVVPSNMDRSDGAKPTPRSSSASRSSSPLSFWSLKVGALPFPSPQVAGAEDMLCVCACPKHGSTVGKSGIRIAASGFELAPVPSSRAGGSDNGRVPAP